MSLLRTRDIMVLASGATQSEKNNRKGHLFEEFVAHLLYDYGYERPQRETLNVSASGIELDVTGAHRMTRLPMIAECKAYSSPLSARELSTFYGKLSTQRLTASNTFGFFVAIPGLVAQGNELRRTIEAHDEQFRVLSSNEILAFLEEKNRIRPLASVIADFHPPSGELSDEALLITEHGLFIATKEIDPTSRLATRVLVFPFEGNIVPTPVIENLRSSNFANGLACIAAEPLTETSGVHVQGLEPRLQAPPTIVEVVGSQSDFEYQYPASPAYFVGRAEYLDEARDEFQVLWGRSPRGRVIVLNAQSGWGKSSFALKVIDEIRKQGGFGMCIDCRTADAPTFVTAAVHRWLHEAESTGVAQLPQAQSYASLQSTIETLRRARISRPIVLFFDQFENVFRDYNTTLEFRNFALAVADLNAPVALGFSWKTDLVAFTEGHPYQLRDDIRSRARVLTLVPFGASDVSQVLGRLQRAAEVKIHRDLREKLSEYSQGLPWLLKKLANHILRELKRGVRQEDLVAEVLNVQSLFDSDLQALSPEEQSALRSIARAAPILATDAVELARSPKIVQSFLDQRLLVQIGERLDVYWDIFRDYLNRGVVPIEDSYILRLSPTSAGKLIRALRKAGGTMSADAAARELGTSRIAVFNIARDLRQLGVLAAVEGALQFSSEIQGSALDIESAIKSRVTVALRRHRAYSLLLSLGRTESRVPFLDFAGQLPQLYPAVVAKSKTWAAYARAFASWFQYAGLAVVRNDEILAGSAGAEQSLFAERKPRAQNLSVFPRCPPVPVLQFVQCLSRGEDPTPTMKDSTLRRALLDAEFLGLVERAEGHRLQLTFSGRTLTAASGRERARVIAGLVAAQPAGAIAERMLKEDPGTKPAEIGRAVAQELGLSWTVATAQACGKWIRGWMREAGVRTRMRTTRRPSSQESLALSDSEK